MECSPLTSWPSAVGRSIAILGALCSVARAQCEYELTIIEAPECPPFPGPPQTYAEGINSVGSVAGYYCLCTASFQAFWWTPRAGFTALEMPPGTSSSRAFAISDQGWIVGEYCAKGDGLGVLGFLETGMDFVSLGTAPSGTFSQAAAINNSGQIVGVWGNNVTGDPAHAAFLWQDGILTDLSSDLGTPNSRAHDINEIGQIVGWMGESQSTARAFVWEAGAVTDLGVLPGGLTAEGLAINNVGQITGQALIESPEDGSLVLHALFWDNGTMTDLGTLPGTTFGRGLDLNDSGQVVGFCNNAILSDLTAFVWHGDGLLDLNDLIINGQGYHMALATAINNAGEIVGWASAPGGTPQAALLTPIDRPIGDLDGDCTVSVVDFLALLDEWGQCTNCVGCPADLDDDCAVGVLDFLLLLDNWG